MGRVVRDVDYIVVLEDLKERRAAMDRAISAFEVLIESGLLSCPTIQGSSHERAGRS